MIASLAAAEAPADADEAVVAGDGPEGMPPCAPHPVRPKDRAAATAKTRLIVLMTIPSMRMSSTQPDGAPIRKLPLFVTPAPTDCSAEHPKDTANSRNGTRAKTVLTETTGPVEIEVPRDRDGTFTPVIVAKRQRRLTGVDEMVLSLYAKGLTTGEISAHFAEIYGASVSKETVSRITDRVLEEMAASQNRPLDEGRFPVIDAIVVKIRDGQVANRPIYAAIRVTLDGEKISSGSGPAPAVKARSSG